MGQAVFLSKESGMGCDEDNSHKAFHGRFCASQMGTRPVLAAQPDKELLWVRGLLGSLGWVFPY